MLLAALVLAAVLELMGLLSMDLRSKTLEGLVGLVLPPPTREGTMLDDPCGSRPMSTVIRLPLTADEVEVDDIPLSVRVGVGNGRPRVGDGLPLDEACTPVPVTIACGWTRGKGLGAAAPGGS